MSVIQITNLYKHFGKVHAVDGISLQVEQGEIFGFLGPNGAGKTTTIRQMMDFIRPTKGEIKLFGLDAQAHSSELKSKIGYLPPDVEYYPHWTGEQHIELFAKLKGSDKNVKALIKRFGFNPKVKSHSLSSGNKQKLGLILALMGEPELLILDEPTASLDPLLQNSLYQYLQEYTLKGGTAFISSHNLAEVERICSRVAIIKSGKLVAVEEIAQLKLKKMHVVTARFQNPVNPDHFKLNNVEILESSPEQVKLKVLQDLNPVLELLAKNPVADLDIDHATLEEVFLSFYEK